ncbi:MAG: hypothetical protein A2X12_03510 [Bacteroidetes bacterium GWE2_29_8]|nr:MAG: hypothetical protein A2X12_03510 [Bacteroidetes bacterium GWE2_29_8]OFY16434.1 MAG: hypothetical protein A2X02_02725 [Bacteroidetes bacterium GWF2_29_10]
MNRLFDDVIINRRAIILTTSIVIAFILAFYLISSYFNGNENIRLNAFRCIPNNSFLIVELNKPHSNKNEIIDKNSIYSMLKDSILCVNIFDKYLEKIKKNLNKDENTAELFEKSKLFISFHEKGKEINPLFIISSTNYIENEARSIFKFIPEIQNTQKEYNNKETIYKVTISDNNYIYVLFKYNLIFFSEKINIINDVINTINTSGNSINENTHLKKLIKTSGANVDANIYFNNNIYKILFNNEQKNESIDKRLLNFSDWSAFDINKNKLDYNLTGFSAYNEKSFLNLFANQTAQPCKAFDVISQNTVYLSFFGISDHTSFFNKISNTSSDEIIDSLKQYMDNEIINFIAEYEQNLFDFTLVKVQNTEQINEILKKYTKNKNEESANKNIVYKTNVNAQTLHSNFAILNNSDEDSLYCSLIDNYVVFCNKEKGIKMLFNDFDNDYVLSKHKDFYNFYEKFNANSNIFYFVKNNSVLNILNEKLPNSYITKFFNIFLKNSSNYTGAQYQYNKDKFYTSFIIDFNKNETVTKELIKETDIIWENNLDTTINSKPYLYTNLINGETEMLVQDINYNLYMFDHEGHRVWKKQIDAFIKDIQFIDFYENDKTQFLINTGKSIHIIDRKGRNVEKYPIIAQNKQEFVFMDFIKKGQIILLTNDENLMMFDKKAKRIKTVKLKDKTNHISKLKGSDKNLYIKISDKGNMIVFDDNFNKVISPTKKLDLNIMIDAYYMNSTKSLFCVTNDNRIVSISNNNQIKYFDIEHSANSITQLLILDFDKDGKDDVCVFDKQNVFVYNLNKEKIFSEPLNITCSDNRIIKQLDDKFFVYCTDYNDNILNIYKSGKGVSNFPVPPSSSCYLYFNKDSTYFLGFSKNKDVKVKQIKIDNL